VLDDLQPAKKVQAPSHFRPGLEFDGNEGTATTEGSLRLLTLMSSWRSAVTHLMSMRSWGHHARLNGSAGMGSG
jgi:hypothetical protein